MIQTQKYEVKNLLITNELLKSYINTFWNNVFTRLVINREDIHLLLLCKVQFADNEMGYRTLGDLRRVNFNDKDLFTNFLIQRLGILNESYITLPISLIEFSYVVKGGKAINTQKHLEDIETKATSITHRFNNMQLPISMNPNDYGTILVNNLIDGVNRFIVNNGTRNYQIDVSLSLEGYGITNKVSILGDIDLNWIDTKLSNDVFYRQIGKSTIYFMGGERILNKKVLTAKTFTTLS